MIAGDEIADQHLANELFDTGVNQGAATAIRYLQESLNLLNRNQKCAEKKGTQLILNELRPLFCTVGQANDIVTVLHLDVRFTLLSADWASP